MGWKGNMLMGVAACVKMYDSIARHSLVCLTQVKVLLFKLLNMNIFWCLTVNFI